MTWCRLRSSAVGAGGAGTEPGRDRRHRAGSGSAPSALAAEDRARPLRDGKGGAAVSGSRTREPVGRRTLEGRWEETMRALQQVEEEYDRFLREQPSCLGEEERARIRDLSRHPRALEGPRDHCRGPQGNHSAARGACHRFGAEQSEQVEATIHWRGGSTSHHTIVRPVRSYEQMHDFDRIVDHLTRWAVRATPPRR